MQIDNRPFLDRIASMEAEMEGVEKTSQFIRERMSEIGSMQRDALDRLRVMESRLREVFDATEPSADDACDAPPPRSASSARMNRI